MQQVAKATSTLSLLGVIETSQRGRVTSPEGVSHTSKREKATDAGGDISILKGTFGKKAANTEVTAGEKNSLEETCSCKPSNINESLSLNYGYSTYGQKIKFGKISSLEIFINIPKFSH